MPDFPPKEEQKAYPAAVDSSLYAGLQPQLIAHPNQTGVVPLGNGIDAFVARLAIISAAASGIDLQYYIYRNDATGKLLTGFLLDAANRGVRVRMLLDDLNSHELDETLMVLARHPTIHIRLFNPNVQRKFRRLGFLADVGRLNHRMHNKALIVDNLLTVVGGRNIGDEYFAANTTLDFGDFDLMTVGESVTAVSAQFDEYWNAPWAQPIDVLSDIRTAPDSLARLQEQVALDQQLAIESDYVARLKQSHLLEMISKQTLNWYWGQAKLMADPADKQLKLSTSRWLIHQLEPHFAAIETEAWIISPYFVPTERGTKMLVDLAKSGKCISVITNSLAATDVLAVHAGYQRYRKTLLAAGVHIYEVKAQSGVRASSWKGSSKSSLHAKSFIFDKRDLFVGSFNFDPRSASLNTELGLLISQPQLSRRITQDLTEKLKYYAYRLALKDDKPNASIIWWDDVKQHSLSVEPDAGIWRTFVASVLGFLPIESQL